jgi:hypothetical protein
MLKPLFCQLTDQNVLREYSKNDSAIEYTTENCMQTLNNVLWKRYKPQFMATPFSRHCAIWYLLVDIFQTQSFESVANWIRIQRKYTNLCGPDIRRITPLRAIMCLEGKRQVKRLRFHYDNKWRSRKRQLSQGSHAAEMPFLGLARK